MIGAGSLVILHLSQPTEKFWGVLMALDGVGLWIRGINVDAFDDWMSEAASDEPPSLGLNEMFVPMSRVERIFLDEQVGAVESYQQRFERRVGISIRTFLDLEDSDELGPAPS